MNSPKPLSTLDGGFFALSKDTLRMPNSWVRRAGFILSGAAFAWRVVRVAPKDTGHDASFAPLMTGHGPARNAANSAAFSVLGVAPLMYWSLAFSEGRGQRVWARLFALGMLAFGSSALLPSLVLRRPYAVSLAALPSRAARWFMASAGATLRILRTGFVSAAWSIRLRWTLTRRLCCSRLFCALILRGVGSV